MTSRSTVVQPRRAWASAALAVAFCVCGPQGRAQLPADSAGVVEQLTRPAPHWVWVNDMAFFAFPDGKAFLVDGDSGKMLGMLSTGYSFTSVLVPKTGTVIYAPETYFSRGTRGTRTDLVSIYDATHLLLVGEIEIPPKRASVMPMPGAQSLTDDDRFLLIYNFTPAQSVTVVDTHSRKFVGEIETAGCALVYPTGPRSFFSICGDGALLETTLTDAGTLARHKRTAELIDVLKDPLSEKGVRRGGTWLFASFEGVLHPLRVSAAGVEAQPTWPLFTPRGACAALAHGGAAASRRAWRERPIVRDRAPGRSRNAQGPRPAGVGVRSRLSQACANHHHAQQGRFHPGVAGLPTAAVRVLARGQPA